MRILPKAHYLLRLTLVGSISASFALLLMTLIDLILQAGNSGELPPDIIGLAEGETELPIDRAGPKNHTNWVEAAVPFKSFVEDEPKSVIILTYQRSGSSFFGQMFNTNPNAFYMFEPLDSLYSALYGTSPGWNIPSDITTFANGAPRTLPQKEVTAVSTFLRNLFTCDVESLPTETLAHRYWTKFGGDHVSSADYVRCLRERNLTLVPCHENTLQFCGRKFGERGVERLDECNRLLWSEKYRNAYPSADVRERFTRYRACSTRLRSMVDKQCVPMLESDCSSRRLRAVKTVRVTMASMESLLESLPNFRVIHLIRDPRAVTLSRIEFDASARAIVTNKAPLPEKMAIEAAIYCRTAAQDVRTRRQLQRKYPGRIYPIMYDDVVRNLHQYVRNVYQGFLEFPLHARTHKWIGANARRKRNGTTISKRWQDKLTVNQNEQILSACAELFELLKLPDAAS